MKMSWMRKLSLSLLIALVVNQDGECQGARILGLFPLNLKSHYVMFETLMRGLAAKGHQVDVISHFPVKNPPPNYYDISIAGSRKMVSNNVTLAQAEHFTTGGVGRMFETTGAEVCELLNLPQFQSIINKPPTNPPYDLVIQELYASDCYLAFGRHLNVPMVAVLTSKLYDWMHLPMGNPMSLSFEPSVRGFQGSQQHMSFHKRLINTVASIIVQLQYRYYMRLQFTHVEKHFDVGASSIPELYKDISVMLVNTHPSSNSVRPLAPGIVEVGGLHVTDGDMDMTTEIKKWLDDSKAGCVYFSFGSMVKIESFPTKTIKAFYTAFEKIAPVRVLMKIANKDELPSGIPKNVMTSSWVPQTRVLQHKNVKAFVTHSGLMSTQEAISYGVPMISVPVFGDQSLNALLCEQKNIAITMNYHQITVESFTKALKTILEDPLYRESSKKLARLFNDRPMSPLDTAIFWVEYVLRNGNVLRSPADDLYWWQVEMLDVYASIIAVVFLTLYAVKRLLCIALCRLLSKFGKKQGTASKSKKNN